jgi:hypothetical protein
MFTPSLSHPIAGQGLIRRHDSYDRSVDANHRLQKEMNQVIDSFQGADNGPSDLNPRDNAVQIRSPKGRNESTFASSYRVDSSSYRDREGYWENHDARTLGHASYRRLEFGADGKPNREVTMSYVDSLDGSLITKTVTDKNGTSLIMGGQARGYEVSYRPGDTIDSQA